MNDASERRAAPRLGRRQGRDAGGAAVGRRPSCDRVKADVARLQKENPEAPGPIPAELVTASASGLDPHISPAVAAWQVPRVADG